MSNRFKFTEIQRQNFVARFRASGMRYDDFARANGVSPASIRRWSARDESCGFTEAQIVPSKVISPLARITWPNGAVLEGVDSVSPRWLAAVLKETP